MNLSLVMVYFSLQTADSLSYLASANSALLGDYCQPSVSVVAGGTATCSLAFEIPSTALASDLRYDDLQGHAATAALPLVVDATGPCATVGTWHKLDNYTCGSCQSNNCGSQQAALDQMTAPGQPCESAATCSCAPGTSRCECEAMCYPTAECVALVQAVEQCWMQHCTQWCK